MLTLIFHLKTHVLSIPYKINERHILTFLFSVIFKLVDLTIGLKIKEIAKEERKLWK